MSFVTFTDVNGDIAVGRVDSRNAEDELYVERLPFIDPVGVAELWALAPYLDGLQGVCLKDHKLECIAATSIVEKVCVFKRTAFYPKASQQIPYYKGLF